MYQQKAPTTFVLVRRVLHLYAGLVLFGVSLAVLVEAGLGLDPWDVLHQGLARVSGWSIGTVVNSVGLLVLLLWLPLRQRPGIGTVSNVIVVGVVADASLALIPTPSGLALRSMLLVGAIVLNAVGTGLYIGAGLGPGPRDGLMTGLAAKGFSIRSARTLIELLVLTGGWLLGGTVGVGTVAYAIGIGPLAQFFIARLSVAAPDPVPPLKEAEPCLVC